MDRFSVSVPSCIISDEALPDVICGQAVTAAINFVDYCCQQTAFMAGRGDIDEEI